MSIRNPIPEQETSDSAVHAVTVLDEERSRGRAVVWAVLAMLATAAPLSLLFIYLGLLVWTHEGGTLGGFGAAADADFHPTVWSRVIEPGLLVLCLLIVAGVGIATYRHKRRSSRTR